MILTGIVVLIVVLASKGGGPTRAGTITATNPTSAGTGGTGGTGASRPVATTRPTCLGTPPSYALGVPPNSNCHNIYAADGPNQLATSVANDPPRVYVPNLRSNTVTIIDQATQKVIQTIPVGSEPQHVVPSYDLKTLWVNNDKGNSLTPIDPQSGAVGTTIPVDDPYNLYFTPDGTRAVVMAEARKRMDFRDPHTMALLHSMTVPCSGLNHMDFSPDGKSAVAACEFDGQLLQVDMTNGQERVMQTLKVGGMPQDVKLSPDGTVYYVADMQVNGVHVIDATTFRQLEVVPTGKGAHGLYPSRDATKLYVSNRGEGSISVIDFATHAVVATWVFNNGKGSPDMGGVSADGKVLWLSGRSDNEMYAIDTTTGKLVTPPIKTGREPHGACVWPQPGRYSIGHTGVMR
ncbi:MAG: YncE family protein [Actinomycetota bacterium]|nr:YncE family protein [Actinomycetota bacterium]